MTVPIIRKYNWSRSIRLFVASARMSDIDLTTWDLAACRHHTQRRSPIPVNSVVPETLKRPERAKESTFAPPETEMKWSKQE